MKQIKMILLSLLCAFSTSLQTFAENVVISVGNDENVQREELIEVDLKTISDKLNLGSGDGLVVKNAFGQQVDYQITYDKKLLIDVAVRPCGEAKYYVSKGIPESMKTWAQGKMYPLRKDDIAWENDRGAYRVYGPALQQSGEKSYGIDVWTKCTPDLDVEERYMKDFDGNVRKRELAKAGKKDEVNEESLKISFHLDHGTGLDCYNVGPSLGCGTPALMDGDKIIMPYCYKDYEILDNGPLRFTVSLTYNPVTIKKDNQVVEHRVISLDKGSNFNKMTVWYEGLSKPCDLVAGVVIHSEDKESAVVGSDFVQYADPTDNPAKHNFQIYVAALFPNGAITKKLMYDKPEEGIEGHAVGIVKNLKNDQKYTYYFGSAWSQYDVRTQNEWQLRINEFLDAIHSPLNVEIN